MTEAEFKSSTDPLRMLEFVQSAGLGSDRKLRLYAAACVRRVWHLLVDERSRKAVEVAESYADGVADRKDRADAEAEAYRAAEGLRGRDWFVALAAKMAVANKLPLLQVVSRTPVDNLLRPDEIEARRCGQADLFRELFGPLLFRPVFIHPSWRNAAVLALATTIYNDRRWDDMPILGDALTEAGCTDAEVLEHCRGTVHAKGCWLTDLLIQKE